MDLLPREFLQHLFRTAIAAAHPATSLPEFLPPPASGRLVLLAAERERPVAGHGVVAAVAALFAARTLWLVPKHGTQDLRLEWWLQPLASPYALLTLGLLWALAVRCYSLSLSGAASGWAVSRSWESTLR